MNENEAEVIDSQNDTEATENVETVPDVDVEALKKENETLKAQKEHWKKKATEKPDKPEPAPEVKSDGLSQADLIYVAKADIHEDDVNDVVELAKLKKVSVKEAHDFMKPILKERSEERKTAAATQTKGGTQGPAKQSPEAIIKKAEDGKLDEADIEKLAEAQMALRLQRIK